MRRRKPRTLDALLQSVARDAGVQAVEFLEHLFARIPYRNEMSEQVPEPYRVLGVLPNAPPWVVEAAYRAWVKLLHPDTVSPQRRADAERQMRALNAAMDAVRTERGWK